jgi:Pyruvate/2-oxoglutarate dehydrogenase complex, dihydrolipoamide acyltransferase (E2) component, and related enzymes
LFFGKLVVTDVLVKEGDTVSIEQPIITLEDDNSSIDIPSPVAGIIYKILVKKRRSVCATRNLQS